MNCQECHQKTCITCDIKMHTGISCREKAEEHEAAQKLQELATAGYFEMKAKACPGCKAPVQKEGGCDYMNCKAFTPTSTLWHVLTSVVGKRCGHQYCWGCLADYGPIRKEGNHHHASTCRNYRHYFINL